MRNRNLTGEILGGADGYPPDKQQKAIDSVLKQAVVLADYWVES